MVKVKTFTKCSYLDTFDKTTAIFATFANAVDALERAGYAHVANTGGKNGRARFKKRNHVVHSYAIIYHYAEGSAL